MHAATQAKITSGDGGSNSNQKQTHRQGLVLNIKYFGAIKQIYDVEVGRNEKCKKGEDRKGRS
jgi:hypothetical protein